MAVRGTMADLIARTRLMVFDTGGSPLFTDQQVQDKLDECREDVRYAILTPKPTYANPGGIQYKDYYAARGFWEADEVLIWGDYTALTPLTSDEIVGHWTFSNQLPPVLIAGKTFDLYRAAYDLLLYKIAALAATEVDFTADGQSFHLSQQMTFLQKMAGEYQRKMRARVGGGGRSDSPSNHPLGIAPNQSEIAGPVSENVPFLTGN